MTQRLHTKIGFQNSSDNKITILELCSDVGYIGTTGKVLNNLYNNTTLAKQLIKEGTHNYASGKIDVSSIVNVSNYTWGITGTDFSEYGVKYANDSSEFLDHHSSEYKYLYMFSEANDKWYVSSNDNQTWRLLDNEL